jgi:uroporphyrinogen decarboxylase
MSVVKRLSPRERVKAALEHREPDRVPVDFVATPEIWDRLIRHFAPNTAGIGPAEYIELGREAVLRQLEVDARVISYDMFCAPPTSILHEDSVIDWWTSCDRSTPNRMWRQRSTDGTSYDIWGTHRRKMANEFGVYEEFVDWPLQGAESISDLKTYAWPEPAWWDFRPLPEILRKLDEHEEYHLRYRIGSVFEIAWQLRGMQDLLMDLAINPEIPRYIMSRITDVCLESTRRVIETAGPRLDMVYFYDDVATQKSLLISPQTWRNEVRPHHARLVNLAHSYGIPVMYHCDGAVKSLIPELIEMGIDLLNPIQPDAEGMEAQHLKKEFGRKLAFHGGIDVKDLLPHGSLSEVRAAVLEHSQVLGEDGGYILCSAHHIQADTPIENILEMYRVSLRYRAKNDKPGDSSEAFGRFLEDGSFPREIS